MTDSTPVDTPIEVIPPNTPEIPLPPNPLDQYDPAANVIIGGAVAASAAMGFAPMFIETAWLVSANSGMVAALALTYQYKWTGDNVRRFILRLMEDSGVTVISVKALSSALKMTGIGFLPGVAINGALNAAITLAIGKAAQHYFKNQGDIPDDELVKFFRKMLGLETTS
jgi:uncharacterized protein (DUF697 family)